MRILVRNAAGAVLGLTDLMENRYQRDGNGNLIGNTLQQDVLAGLIDPGKFCNQGVCQQIP